MEVIIQDSLF